MTVLLRLLGGCLIATSGAISVALLADHPHAMVLALLAHAVVLIAVNCARLEPPAATDDELLALAEHAGIVGRLAEAKAHATLTAAPLAHGRHALTDDTPTSAIRVVPANVAR